MSVEEASEQRTRSVNADAASVPKRLSGGHDPRELAAKSAAARKARREAAVEAVQDISDEEIVAGLRAKAAKGDAQAARALLAWQASNTSGPSIDFDGMTEDELDALLAEGADESVIVQARIWFTRKALAASGMSEAEQDEIVEQIRARPTARIELPGEEK